MRSSGIWSFTLISISDSIPKKGANAPDFGIDKVITDFCLKNNIIFETKWIEKKDMYAYRLWGWNQDISDFHSEN